MASNAANDRDGLICVGMITAPHGVRGAVRLKSYTADPEAVFAYGPLFDDSGATRFDLRCVGHVRDQLIVKIEGVNDRDRAEGMRGVKLFIPRSALPEAEEEEYYLADLIGLAVEHVDGTRLGSVRGVADFGAGDVVEIALARGGVMVVPFSRQVVPVVDLAGGRLVVDPPEGMMGEDEEAMPPRRRRRQPPGKGGVRGPRPVDPSDAGRED